MEHSLNTDNTHIVICIVRNSNYASMRYMWYDSAIIITFVHSYVLVAQYDWAMYELV